MVVIINFSVNNSILQIYYIIYCIVRSVLFGAFMIIITLNLLLLVSGCNLPK